MRLGLIAAAGLLAYGAWELSRQVEAPADETGDWLSTADDVLSSTVTSYLGFEMTSRRYEAAVTNPNNAAIVGLLRAAETRYGIPDNLLVRQAWQESRFNPRAVSPVGAQGLMQFMPATAKEWGVNAFDPASSADGAGRYMKWLYGRTGSWPLALAAYNWGIGNVLKKGMAAAPTETRNYVAQIGADTGLA